MRENGSGRGAFHTRRLLVTKDARAMLEGFHVTLLVALVTRATPMRNPHEEGFILSLNLLCARTTFAML